MAKLLSGKEVRNHMTEHLLEEIENLGQEGIKPCLASLRVGEDQPSISYEKSIGKILGKLGIVHEKFVYDKDIKQEDLIKNLTSLGEDDDIHGIMIFLPLPDHLDEKLVCQAIPLNKDVDGLRLENLGKIMAYEEDKIVNNAVLTILEFLDYYKIGVWGKRVCLLGAGRLINRPLSMLLLERGATVLLTNSKTENLAKIASQAQILISAMGKARFVNKDFTNPDQIILDAGTSVVDGKFLGDLDIESVKDHVKAYTPSPGGISSVTTYALAKQVVNLAKRESRANGPS